MNLLDYVKQERHSNFIFVKPFIPENRKKNALAKICPDLNQNDEILVLMDESAFGNGKVGIVITNEYIYFREHFADPFKFAFKDIKEFATKLANDDMRAEIFINGELVYKFVLGNDSKFVDKIFQGFKQYMQARFPQMQKYDKDDEYERYIPNTYMSKNNYPNQSSITQNQAMLQSNSMYMQGNSLLRVYEQDDLISELKILKAVDTGLGAAAVAADLFSSFILKIDTNFSQKSNDQEVKDDVKKSIVEIISLLRDNVDRLHIPSLQNDIATTEFILFASALIYREVVDRGYPKFGAFEMIRMTLFDIFGQNTRHYLPIIKEICSDIDSHEEAALHLLIRLYFTNNAGYTLPFNFIEKMDTNKIATHIMAYAEKNGFAVEINPYDDLFGSVIRCMQDLGVTDILDEDIVSEAYHCVNKLCR